MARQKRLTSPTGMYHVLLRGIDELFSEEKDFKEFEELIKKYFDNSDASLLGYVLMKNRVHLAIAEGKSGLPAVMKPICTSYARYYNRVYGLQGKLFYDRYKSEPIMNDDAFDELMAFFSAIPSDNKSFSAAKTAEVSLRAADDYCRMTDEELKEYIEYVFSCSVSDMTTEEKKVLAEKIIEGKRIGAGRIYKLFELGRMPAKTVKKQPKELTKSKDEEVAKPKKSDLSVWLL